MFFFHFAFSMVCEEAVVVDAAAAVVVRMAQDSYQDLVKKLMNLLLLALHTAFC